jgi:type I restriction enzyme S subunit
MRKSKHPIVRLGDIVEVSPRTPKMPSDMDVSFLGMTDVSEDGKIINNNIRKYAEVSKGYTPFRDGDILVAKITPCFENGKGALVHSLTNGIGFGSTEFHVLRPSEQIDPYLLLNITQSKPFRVLGESEMSGSAGQKRVPSSFIADYEIPLPPLPEQRKIAAILRTWDEAIQKLEKALQLKRKIRTSLIAHTISNQTPNTPLKHFVTNVGRAVPKPLEPYSSLGLRSHCKGTFQRFVEDFNRVEMDTLYQVKANDLIVNITFAWEGAVAIVKPEDEHCLVSHRFPTYEIDLKKAYPDFVRYIIQTRRFTELMGIISPGGAGRNRVLNKKDFLEQKVWLPDLKTQKFIGDLLCKAEEDINVTLKLFATYKSQKRGLMQKLLTGEWREQVDKEAA